MRPSLVLIFLVILSTSGADASAQDSKDGISETSIDEVKNTKAGASKSPLSVDKVLKDFDKAGLKTSKRTEILGKLVGAAYCAQAEAGGVAFTLCEYAAAAQVEPAKPKRAAMFGEKNTEHVNGAAVLSTAEADGEKAKIAARRLGEVFDAIGKPAATKDAKKEKEKMGD